jgi:sugar phosphate isomerase/epimerase
MQHLKPLEPGVMFWAGSASLAEVRSLGLRCGQLGIPPGLQLTADATQDWKAALERDAVTLVTVFAAYEGESYADIPTVRRTVGFIPRATRDAREWRTVEISDFAAQLGVGSIACHIGCVPEDPADPDYIAVREMVRRICDHAAAHRQTFALETGQEAAPVLLRFMEDVDRPNLRINFDPANMILYGTGEPIEALRAVAAHVASVHCKDGDWPPANVPGALGTERPLGHGSVGIERFVRALAEVRFRGPLNIEREGTDHRRWLQDVGDAAALLRRVVAGIG